MINFVCEQCGIDSKMYKSYYLRRQRHFCSRKCSSLFFSKFVISNCGFCKNIIIRSPHGKEYLSFKNHFCSIKCQAEFNRSKNIKIIDSNKYFRCADCKEFISEKLFSFSYRLIEHKGAKRCRDCSRKRSNIASVKYRKFYLKGGKYFNHSKARSQVHQALISGKIIKGNCIINNECEGRIEAHHKNGYDKKHYLDICWLCSKHHSLVDRGNLMI